MDPHDLAPGDRVALLVPGSVAYAELVIALLRRGVFPVPMDVEADADRARGTAARPRARAGRDHAGAARGAARRPPRTDPALGPPRGRPIHLTSGTTGRPKGVFSGLLEPAEAEALLAEERELWGFSRDDVNLVLSPIHHSAPLRFAMGTLLAGGRVVLPGSFDPATATAAIVEQRPTSMFCVPAHLQRLFAHWDEHGAPELSSFRLVAHAGAPCPEWVKRRLIEDFPAGSTWEFYGSTEGQFTACRSEEWLERPGTLGRARPGRVMTVDEDGHLWCVVPPHARFSYLGDEEKTAAAWRETSDGPAFTVGDLGRIDEDGYVFLDGRREDLIISGGRERLPRRGRAGPRRGRPVSRTSRCTASTTSSGVSGSAPRSWASADEATLEQHMPGSTSRPPSGPRSTTASSRSPARPPGRYAASTCPTCSRDAGGGGLMGFTTEELQAFRDVEVPDLLPEPPDPLELLFVGINPGLWTAAVQTHFAHPANRFYPALLGAGIITEPVSPSAGMTDEDRDRFRRRGLGITNLVSRASARASELSAAELREGGEHLRALVRERRPRVVAILGITAYRQAFGVRKARLGRQPEPFEGAELWVVPNPSGLNAHETIASLAEAYAEPARAAGVI